jgi:hypothetical protein
VLVDVFLAHLAEEVLALVDDLLVLVVPRGLEGGLDVGFSRQHAAGQQHRGA